MYPGYDLHPLQTYVRIPTRIVFFAQLKTRPAYSIAHFPIFLSSNYLPSTTRKTYYKRVHSLTHSCLTTLIHPFCTHLLCYAYIYSFIFTLESFSSLLSHSSYNSLATQKGNCNLRSKAKLYLLIYSQSFKLYGAT